MSSAEEGRARELGFVQYPGYVLGDAANNPTFIASPSFLYCTGVRK